MLHVSKNIKNVLFDQILLNLNEVLLLTKTDDESFRVQQNQFVHQIRA